MKLKIIICRGKRVGRTKKGMKKRKGERENNYFEFSAKSKYGPGENFTEQGQA